MIKEADAFKSFCPIEAMHYEFCQGSICMAWHWERNVIREGAIERELPPVAGYCGLCER